MVLPGHLAGGYLITSALLGIFQPGFSHGQINALLIIGTLAGELPDVDTVFPVISHLLNRKPRKESHREHITHAPLFWLAISVVVVIVGLFASSAFIRWIGVLVLAGTWTHFLLDSIEWGIWWLWPFSSKRFFMRNAKDDHLYSSPSGTLSNYWEFTSGPYLKTATFYFELLVTAAALVVLFSRI